jgi:hypothetical protein
MMMMKEPNQRRRIAHKKMEKGGGGGREERLSYSYYYHYYYSPFFQPPSLLQPDKVSQSSKEGTVPSDGRLTSKKGRVEPLFIPLLLVAIQSATSRVTDDLVYSD